MHEENFLSGWLRKDEEGVKEELQRVNEQAKQKWEKRGAERRSKEGVGSGVSSDVFEDLSSVTEWENDGHSLGILVCVLAVSSFVIAVLVVLVVLFSPSDVNVVGEVALSESACEIVESQTFSLSKNARSVYR